MADQFEEVIEQRVAALEVQAADEAKSVKEHFAELREFITFTVTTHVTELKGDIYRIEQRLGGVEQRLGGVEQRLESLEHFNRKVEAHHEATRLILSDILERLPAKHG